MVTIATWALMVVVPPTPGLVDSREADFSMILEKSLELGGVVPDSSLYCSKSTVTKKYLSDNSCPTTKAGPE